MKSVVLLTLFALAHSTPLTSVYNNFEDSKETLRYDTLGGPVRENWVIQDFPAQQTSQQMGEQIQQASIGNSVQDQKASLLTDETNQSALADQAAKKVIEQALLTRQRQTAERIDDLQKQLIKQEKLLKSTPSSSTWERGLNQVPTIEAIQKLQRQLKCQQAIAPQITVNSQLARTLETVIQAQLATSEIKGDQYSLTGSTEVLDRQSKTFQTKIQKLIDINNVKEIEVEMVKQQATIDLLEAQRQLVNQQIQETQNQQSLVYKTYQLQRALDTLRLQEQQLRDEIFACKLALQELQYALEEQQEQLERDIRSEKLFEGERLTQRNIFCKPVAGNEKIERCVVYGDSLSQQISNRKPIYGQTWTETDRIISQPTWLL